MRTLVQLAAIAGALTACAPTSTDEEDPGELCACQQVDGEEICCYGNGTCEDQDEGPRRCECTEGAAGDTCATPPPGVYPGTLRECVDNDPACMAAFDFVEVEAFGECVDLDGKVFDSSIVRPATDGAGNWPDGSFPIAVLVHGASQAYSDYFDLLEHLARNGIVAASIDGTFAGDPYVRANRLLAYLECLGSRWRHADRHDGRFALAGHSRGGTAAALAANAVASGLVDPPPAIEAVVQLAPTLTDAIGVTSADTPALLVMQGSRDPDATGAGLSWYDLAGDPASSDEDGLSKISVWAYGATHHRFHAGLIPANGELEASITGPDHWTLARAYVGGFLMWRLFGTEQLRGHFDGTATAPSVASIWGPDSPQVFFQISEGRRLVIHDFEGDTLSPAPVGAAVTMDSVDVIVVGALQDVNLPYSQRLRTGGLWISWSAGTPRLTVSFDTPIDVTAFSHVSLRAGRPFDPAKGECKPAAAGAQGVELMLRTPDAEHAEGDNSIPVPDHFAPETLGNWLDGDCQAVDFLKTIRIPLQAYCDAGLDLSQVEAVELSFPGDAASLAVDDIELTLPPGFEPVGAGCSPP